MLETLLSPCHKVGRYRHFFTCRVGEAGLCGDCRHYTGNGIKVTLPECLSSLAKAH